MELTYFKGEAAENSAPWPAGEPQEDGVRARAPLRLHEVVEELRPGVVVHAHVPGLQVEGQRAVESRQVRHHRRRAGRRQKEEVAGSGETQQHGETAAAAASGMHRKRKLQGHAWDRVWMCDEWRMRGRVATCRVPWDCVDFDCYS